jgi:hypothetical protein
MVAVDLSEEAYTAMRLSSWHEVGSKTVRRCIAPQPVLTRYKLLEIERLECGIFAPPLPPPASTSGCGVLAALAAPPARDGSTPQQRTARRGAAERRLDMRLKMG